MRAAIVGGGISGLCTALHLERRGVDVTVYEASASVGGAMGSVIRDGYLAETGPHSILDSHPAVTRLFEAVGLQDQVITANESARNRYVIRDGRPVALPMSPPALIKSSLWSTSAKLRLLAEPFVPTGESGADESLADFVRRRLGSELLDYGVGVLVNGVWAGDAEKLSARYSFRRLYQLEQEYGSILTGGIRSMIDRRRRNGSRSKTRMISFRRGNGVLPRAISEHLADVRTSTPVEAIHATDDGVRVRYRTPTGVAVSEHDVALVTTSAHALTEIDFHHPPDFADEVYAPPVAVVTLGFRREDVSHPLDGFGALFPVVEDFRVLGTLFCSSLFEGRAPDGHVTLASFVGGARRPELARLSPQDRRDLVLQDLRQILGVTGDPTFEHQTSWERAIPQYEVGWGRVKVGMQAFEKLNPGVFLGGNLHDGIAIPDLIAAAERHADRIVDNLQGLSAA